LLTALASVFEERICSVQLVVMQKELQATLLQPPPRAGGPANLSTLNRKTRQLRRDCGLVRKG